MGATVIRLLSIKLNNLKNVGRGVVEMPHYYTSAVSEESAEILGVYGQNGSGKTAIIDALTFIKELMSGVSLSKDAVNYIEDKYESAVMELSFYIHSRAKDYRVDYSFEVGRALKVDNDGIKRYVPQAVRECIAVADGTDREAVGKPLMDVNYGSRGLFEPKECLDELAGEDESEHIDLLVIKRICQKELRSFIFATDIEPYIKEAAKRDCKWELIAELKRYAQHEFFVINQGHNAVINLDFAMPISLQYENDSKTSDGDMLISLSEPTVFGVSRFNIFKRVMTEINRVIGAMIPGLELIVKEYGSQATSDGKDGVRFELMSRRGDSIFPLRYESSGVKKIISVLNIIALMYNNPSVFVAIDELDAGVFEFLLGELLRVISETGCGQLLFTSHNLRPLEMLDKDSMLFTTANHDNRYIRLSNIRDNNNLREIYIKSLRLGGQEEEISSKTLRSDIRQALYGVGEGLYGE